ncbi:hypothetical protein [Aureliella helgolandensis]|uniref:hypothetical protein n=1 Tax=Aureliella helgolandensis TaxID=2527968 RepID=UPI0018D11543|nr:hypothetical protein [Aureliella helgolandensis]
MLNLELQRLQCRRLSTSMALAAVEDAPTNSIVTFADIVDALFLSVPRVESIDFLVLGKLNDKRAW